MQLIEVRPGLTVVDLGCGTGALTAELAEALPDCDVLGIDTSPTMLDKASSVARENLRFELRAIEDVSGAWDLIFSNSAVHWVEDHRSLMPRLWSMLRPGGQLALQFPSRHRNRAHKVIAAVAARSPFREAMDGWAWDFPVLDIETYAEILYEQGGRELAIFDRVYPHILKNADEALKWVSSTTLRPYMKRLPEDLHDSFNERLREELWSIWPSGPFLFPFRRLLLCCKKPGEKVLE